MSEGQPVFKDKLNLFGYLRNIDVLVYAFARQEERKKADPVRINATDQDPANANATSSS